MPALFINSNQEFIQKLGKSHDDSYLVTDSFAEAFRCLDNPELMLSAIYLNPNDANHSALQFLGQTLLKRPATPLYILDDEGDLSPQNFSTLSDNFNICGAFRGKKSIWELLKPIQIDIPIELKVIDKRVLKKSEHPGFIAVPLIDFIHSKHYAADVFVESDSEKLCFFAAEGAEVDLDYLSKLARKNSWLYIEEAAVLNRVASFHSVQSDYLDPAYLSPSWRTAETFYRTKIYLESLKANGVSERLLTETYEVFQNLFQLTAQFNEDASLGDLINQAKACDRTIAVVTLAVLLCKKLRFEKSSIVETLGVASLLQDVSLYRSPHGDISAVHSKDLPESAKAYYLNHPTRSAELLSASVNIPELTLQIVRQQHERSDRTGFPNRVGGAQLQPLAEILSIINSYLDEGADSVDFLWHYSNWVAAPFQQLMAQIKKSH